MHKLIAERKLAPFYLGLQDFEEDWDAGRIVAALDEAEQQATRNLKDAHAAAIETANEAEAAQLSAPSGTRKHKESVTAYNAAVLHRERLAEVLKIREKKGGGALQTTNKTDQAKLYVAKALECPICFLCVRVPFIFLQGVLTSPLCAATTRPTWSTRGVATSPSAPSVSSRSSARTLRPPTSSPNPPHAHSAWNPTLASCTRRCAAISLPFVS